MTQQIRDFNRQETREQKIERLMQNLLRDSRSARVSIAMESDIKNLAEILGILRHK